MKRFLLLGILYLFFPMAGALAQTAPQSVNVPQLVPSSPEAGSLAKYINYPVSYNTGLPQIDIPLFEIKLNDFTLPISLSYHASAIKLYDRSSWVGMNWTLNAEPVINRSVNRIADEKTNGYLSSGRTGPTINPSTHVLEGLVSSAGSDTEPDNFNYRLPTGGGSFLFSKTSSGVNILKYPYTPLNVAYSVSDPQTAPKLSFTLKDDQGNQYTFPNNNNIERIWSMSAYPNNQLTQNVTAWKASQIVTRNNHIIAFSYFSEVVDTYPTGSNYLTIYRPNIESDISSQMDVYGTDIVGHYSALRTTVNNRDQTLWQTLSTQSPYLNFTENRLYYNYLQSITFPGGRIVIEKQPNHSRQIKNIKLLDDNNSQIKRVEFFQRSWSSNTPAGSQAERWLLDSIVIYDARNIAIERYKFTYNYASIWGGSAYSSRLATDNWGYYLGTDGGGAGPDAYPTFSSNSMLQQEIKVTSRTTGGVYYYNQPIRIGGPTLQNKMGGVGYGNNGYPGSLLRIDYPTGGSTRFVWEKHKVKDYTSTEQGVFMEVGGQRIKEIKDYDELDSLSMTRRFVYGELEKIYETRYNRTEQGPDGKYYDIFDTISVREIESNAGILREKVTPESYFMSQIKINSVGNVEGVLETYYESPIGRFLYESGSPVAYTKVTEYRINHKIKEGVYQTYGGMPEGKTIYRYAYNGMETSRRLRNTSKVYNIHGGKALEGKLLSQEVYRTRYSYDQYFLVSKKANEYTSPITSPTFYVPAAHKVVLRSNGDPKTTDYIFEEFQDGVDYALLKKETESTYIYTNESDTIPSNVITQTTAYEYDKGYSVYGTYYPIRTTTNDSKGLVIKTETQYAPTYGTSSGATTIMNAKNWVSAPASILQYYNNALISRLENYYDTPSANLVTLTRMSLYNSNTLSKQFTVDLYDTYGNPQQRTLLDGIKEVYLWSYKGKYPIAHIYNADYATVTNVLTAYSITNFSAKINPSDFEITSFIAPLRTDSRLSNAMVTTYVHKPLVGVSTVIDPNNQSTHYEYDSFGRLATVRDNELNIVSRNSYHYQNKNDLETVLKPVPVLTKDISGNYVRLDWNTSPGYTYDVQYFNYYDNDRTYRTLSSAQTSGNYTYYDSSPNGGYYYFRVLACKGSSKVASNEVYAEIKKLPQTFSAYADRINAQSAYVYWSASDITNQASGGTFTVQRAVYKSSGQYYDYDYTTVASGLYWMSGSYTDNSRQSGVQYVYRVTYTVNGTDIRSNVTSPV